MNMSLFQVVATLFIVGATITLFVARQKYMATASGRRMMSMLERVGLDPTIALSDVPDSVLESVIEVAIREARQRCRACSTIDECERWLAGNEDGDNVFCLNARVFNALKTVCDDIANNQYTGAI